VSTLDLAVTGRMARADLLKLRKRRGTLGWSLLLALVPVILFFGVKAGQHSSDPTHYLPAGGIDGFRHGLQLIGLFFGPLVAVLVGVEAGAGDSSAGVFRDLVATGRSRVALFATRVPAALAVCWAVILAGFALVVLGAFAFADSRPTPSGTLIAEALGFILLSTGAICAISVGFASLTNSKAGSIVALVAWNVIASPLLASISSLGSARKALLEQALLQFRPIGDIHGHGGEVLAMSTGSALVVLLAWLAVLLGLGAWRTSRMDA
jgi:ABC-type transport system involved in multi-copper enzyme maturation permease subunit